MKTAFLLIAITLFSVFPVSVFPVLGGSGELSGNFSFAAGVLSTDDDFVDAFDMDQRVEIGVICDVKKEKWPVSIVVAYFLSYGNSKTTENAYGLMENRDTDLYCSETYIGIKKFFDYHPYIKPYVTGGFHTVSMYADISYDREYDGAFGGWYGAGAYVTISKAWQLNLAWRRSKAKVDLFGSHLDAGGDHFDLSIGYHFPQ